MKKSEDPDLKKRRAAAKVTPTSSSSQPTLRKLKGSIYITKPTGKLGNLILSFIVKGLHPLSTVEQPEFIKLVKGTLPALFNYMAFNKF